MRTPKNKVVSQVFRRLKRFRLSKRAFLGKHCQPLDRSVKKSVWEKCFYDPLLYSRSTEGGGRGWWHWTCGLKVSGFGNFVFAFFWDTYHECIASWWWCIAQIKSTTIIWDLAFFKKIFLFYLFGLFKQNSFAYFYCAVQTCVLLMLRCLYNENIRLFYRIFLQDDTIEFATVCLNFLSLLLNGRHCFLTSPESAFSAL